MFSHSYKYGIKGSKHWNSRIGLIVYGIDVIFNEFKSNSNHEYEKREGELEKIIFELENRESKSMNENELHESNYEEEP